MFPNPFFLLHLYTSVLFSLHSYNNFDFDLTLLSEQRFQIFFMLNFMVRRFAQKNNETINFVNYSDYRLAKNKQINRYELT